MLDRVIAAIGPLDSAAMEACQLRLDNLTKPLGSLHGLEQLARRLAGITRSPRPAGLKKCLIVMAADHGVADEGVSAFPREVTAQMVCNFCRGTAAVNVLARHAGAELVVVDAGVAAKLPELPGLTGDKAGFGAANITHGPAMTREAALRAVEAGIRAAEEQVAQGASVVGLGEMGIGNTTPSAAIVACYSGRPVRELVGPGTGISGAALDNKVRVVEQALAVNRPDADEPLEVLAKVGGYEIAGLAGVMLAAAAGRAAVVLDGVASCAAAVIAARLAPQVREYLIGSHFSCEPAQRVALELIGVEAYLHLKLRLEEGTGAALGMRLIDAGLHVLNDMKTFGEADVAVAQDGPGALRQRREI